MLDIHAKYSELVQSVFSSDQQFYGALDKVIIHHNNSSSNNSISYDGVYGAVIQSVHGHCENSPSSFEDGSMSAGRMAIVGSGQSA